MIFLFISIFFFDYLPILKAKDKKTSWVYGALFVSSFVVLALMAVNITVPSPSGPIKFFFSSLLKLK